MKTNTHMEKSKSKGKKCFSQRRKSQIVLNVKHISVTKRTVLNNYSLLSLTAKVVSLNVFKCLNAYRETWYYKKIKGRNNRLFIHKYFKTMLGYNHWLSPLTNLSLTNLSINKSIKLCNVCLSGTWTTSSSGTVKYKFCERTQGITGLIFGMVN